MNRAAMIPLTLLTALAATSAGGQPAFQTDSFPAEGGTLELTFFGHASLMVRYGDLVIYTDPVSIYADYGRLPKADIILVTHEHGDHLDAAALSALAKSDTIVVANESAAGKIPRAVVLRGGEKRDIRGVAIETVPAYNTTAGRDRYHPQGRDNGYVFTLGGKRIYVAGDSEDTPEMKSLKAIDIAFLPMNQPYTMTPEQVAAAARAMKPAVLYPYHYGDTDTRRLVELLKGSPGIDVRIRALK